MPTPIYRCDHCLREFARSEHLVRHERTHTKEKPYECGQCSQTFSRQDLLRRHETKSHRQLQRRDQGASRKLIAGRKVQGRRSNNAVQTDLESLTTENRSTVEAGIHLNHTALSPPETHSPNDWQTTLLSGVLPISNFDSSARSSFANMSDHLNGSPGLINIAGDAFDEVNLTCPTSTLYNTLITPQWQHPCVTPDLLLNDLGPALRDAVPLNESTERSAKAMPKSNLILTEDRWQMLKCHVDLIDSEKDHSIPSRLALSGFISRFFGSFHRHQPFLHESTWSPNESPSFLILAVCANGAAYNLEYEIAVQLFNLSNDLMKSSDNGLHTLQALMLLTAITSWSGDIDNIQLSGQLQGRMTIAVRREWNAWREGRKVFLNQWERWRTYECLKRVTYCVFTVTNLMAVAYDLQSAITLEDEYGLPAPEDQWCASSEAEWSRMTDEYVIPEWKSAGDVMIRLFDSTLPPPAGIGMFSCHIIISLILQKILFLEKASYANEQMLNSTREIYFHALRRWQLMWESEPDSSLSPDHPRGPMSFNCTAILRIAYVRLVANYAPLRRTFSACASEYHIAQSISQQTDIPERNGNIAAAALQACMALRIPANIGFKVVSRTGFWVWSVQHGLAYFECAIFLSKWLQKLENVNDMTDSEIMVRNMVLDVLSTSHPQQTQEDASQQLSVMTLLLWAELLDTGDATVWKIIPKMGQVLRQFAQILSSN